MAFFNFVLVVIVHLCLVDGGHHKRYRYPAPKWTLARSGQCGYEGYQPGGGVTNIGQIKAPVAELRSANGIAGDLSTHTSQTAAVMDAVALVSKTVAKIAETMGPVLGIFGAAFDIIDAQNAIGPQDIIDATNTAVAKLTNDINDKMEKMKGYVDKKVIELCKVLVERDYKVQFRLWSSCIQEPTAARSNECQEDSYRSLSANRPKFAVFAGKVFRHQLSDDEIRQVEVYLVPYRDYVNLVSMELIPLIKTFCKAGGSELDKEQCRRYTGNLVEQMRYAKTYCEAALKQIKAYHARDDCKKSYKCGKAKMEATATAGFLKLVVDCRCELDLESYQICKVKATWSGSQNAFPYARYSQSSLFGATAGAYMREQNDVVSTYWKVNLEDFFHSWDLEIKLARNYQREGGLGAILPLGEASPRFAARWKAAVEAVEKMA